VCTSESHGGSAGSFQALVDTDTRMEILEIEEKRLLDGEVEVTTYCINNEDSTNCAHIDIKIGNGNVKVVIDTGSEISLITEDLRAHLLSQGLEMWELKLQSAVLVRVYGSRRWRIEKQLYIAFLSVMIAFNMLFSFLFN
jgi:hypothetical protein